MLIPLRYNEEKVINGTAERIRAENFLKEHDRLSKTEIIERFRQRSSQYEGKGDEAFHFSLNFGRQEALSNETMAEIADRFMDGMGYGEQPYVVYRHWDAGHTHMHIVATAVRADGSVIFIRPRDYHRAHTLSRILEKEYGLEKSVAVAPDREEEFAVDHAQKVIYGEPGTQRALSDVLHTVFGHYNYTSLDEYNAILRQYNVTAYRGKEDSRLFQSGGLFYHTLDENGKTIGNRIKASKFLLKPTLKNLEQKFEENQAQREVSRERLSTAIEWALAGRKPDWAAFTASLENEGVSVVLAKDDDRVFFVDHTGKSSFEGKNLGEEYALEVLRQRCAPADALTDELIQQQQLRLHL